MLRKQQGGALLTALFIMTLVAIVATAMSMRLQTDIYRTQTIVQHDKMFLASQAVSFWGLSELSNAKVNYSKVLPSGMVAEFPSSMSQLAPQIQVSGGMYDLQGLFNINSIADRKYLISFLSLLTLAVPDLNRNQASTIGLALMDWLSPYDPSHGKDAFMSYYSAQKPPYYPSHQLMLSASELRLVKDVTASRYRALEAYITALPETTPININTASKIVLQSLLIGVPENRIDEALELRGENGITNQKDLNEFLDKTNIPGQQVTIESQYFMTVASVKIEDHSLVVYSLLKRKLDNNKRVKVSLIHVSRVYEG